MRIAYFIFAMGAAARADSLDAVLQRMDQAAVKFRSLTAKVHRVEYSDVLSDKTEEDGTFKMMKHAKTGVVLLGEFTGKDERMVRLAGSQAQVYYPHANQVDEYDTRKFTKSADLLVLVGFGTTRAELEKTYTISLGGNETVGTAKTTRIDLTPKSNETKKLFNVIQLWIPDGAANPIQEKVLSGKRNQDYKLFLFSDEQIRTSADPALPEADFKLNLPAGVKRMTPGK